MAKTGTLFQKKPDQAVIASIIGNIIEYYDFVIYAYFSASIGRTFFRRVFRCRNSAFLLQRSA